MKISNISKAFTSFTNLNALKKTRQSSEFVPINTMKDPEFVVVQRVTNGTEVTTHRRTLHVVEDGISIIGEEGENEFVPFFNIKKFYVTEDSTEWKLLRILKGGEKYDILSFRTPRAAEIQAAVTSVIDKVVRDRRSMTM